MSNTPITDELLNHFEANGWTVNTLLLERVLERMAGLEVKLDKLSKEEKAWNAQRTTYRKNIEELMKEVNHLQEGLKIIRDSPKHVGTAALRLAAEQVLGDSQVEVQVTTKMVPAGNIGAVVPSWKGGV